MIKNSTLRRMHKRTHLGQNQHVHSWIVAGPLLKSRAIVCYCEDFGNTLGHSCNTAGVVKPTVKEYERAYSLAPGESYPWPGSYWRVKSLLSSQQTVEVNEVLATVRK